MFTASSLALLYAEEMRTSISRVARSTGASIGGGAAVVGAAVVGATPAVVGAAVVGGSVHTSAAEHGDAVAFADLACTGEGPAFFAAPSLNGGPSRSSIPAKSQKQNTMAKKNVFEKVNTSICAQSRRY